MNSTRLEILRSLRKGNERSFSTLLDEVAETSDNLTYHLKHLVKEGYIHSPRKGKYSLSGTGLVFINTNQEKYGPLFPTLSCMIVIRSGMSRLLMRKTKLPYVGRLHDVTFAIHSDGSLEENIAKFLDRYQLKLSNLCYVNTLRLMKKSEDVYVFDKTFVVYTADLSSYTEKIADRVFELHDNQEIIDSPDVLQSTKMMPDLLGRSGFVEVLLDFGE